MEQSATNSADVSPPDEASAAFGWKGVAFHSQPHARWAFCDRFNPGRATKPRFLEAANDKFGGDEFEARVLDIEGCYPQMPKDKIRHAMRQLVHRVRDENGTTGSAYPRAANGCSARGRRLAAASDF